MSRYTLITLIVLGLAVLGLALLHAQAQSPTGTIPVHDGASCATVCPLPGEGHPLPTESAQPFTARVDADDFPSLLPRSELPPPVPLVDSYLPVTLHSVPAPFTD